MKTLKEYLDTKILAYAMLSQAYVAGKNKSSDEEIVDRLGVELERNIRQAITELLGEVVGNDREEIDYVMDVKNLYPDMENESRHYAEGEINGYNQAKSEIRERIKQITE